jgi:hypothetical protein
MIHQAGDLGVELDTGLNQPGAVLQRLTDGERQDYPPDKPLVWPLDYTTLPPGQYRLREK